jgi:zinc transporter ZupT
MGVSNAIAGGMMCAASYSLLKEAVFFNEVDGLFKLHSIYRTLLGIVIGIIFILATKKVLDQHEHLKLGEIQVISFIIAYLLILILVLL